MKLACLPALVLLAAPAAALGTGNVLKVPQDFGTIQAAVDAAADGDTIEIGGGTYLETVVVDGFTSLTLRAKGKVVIDSDAGAAALTLSNCTDCVVEKVRAEDGPGHGILVVASAGCSLEKCRVEDVAGDGIRVEDSTGVTLEKCTVRRPGADGIVLNEGAGALPTDCLLTGNKVFDAGDDGLDFNGTDCVLEKNLVHEPVEDGLDNSGLPSGSGNTVEANKFVKAGAFGVILGGDANVLRGNKVVQCVQRAFHVISGTGHVLEDNTVAKSGNDGVRVEDEASGVSILGNKFRKPGDDGVEVDGPDAVVDGNKVSGAVEDGFEVDGTGGLYTDNKATGCQESGFQISEGTGNTLTGNKAKGNKDFDLLDLQPGLNDIDLEANDFGTVGPSD